MAFTSIILFAERDELSDSLGSLTTVRTFQKELTSWYHDFIRFAGLYFDQQKCVIISVLKGQGFVIFLLVVIPFVACGSPCHSWTVIG